MTVTCRPASLKIPRAVSSVSSEGVSNSSLLDTGLSRLADAHVVVRQQIDRVESKTQHVVAQGGNIVLAVVDAVDHRYAG